MARKKIKLKHKLQYRFDNLMTGSILPPIIILLLFSAFLTFVFTVIILSFQVHRKDEPVDNYLEAYWQTLMHVIDQGTITGEAGWAFRLIMFPPTLFGLLLVVTLVGLISSQINTLLLNLRKGRSLVIEKGHIVILGWSSKIFPIINELIKANANQKKARIVILANKDKVEMEDEIVEKVDIIGRTKIICRTGNPIDLNDLDIINPHEAKSVIIVSSDDNRTDAQNIKCILAIINHPNRKKDLYHIVAEIKTDKNKEIANIIGGDELTLIVSNDVIARIVVQTCLQSGLSVVYHKLLDFSDAEIYFHQVMQFYGQTFKEILMGFENNSIIGIQRANGIILINPNMDTKIKEGDKAILIAEDDEVLGAPDSKNPQIEEEVIVKEHSFEKTPYRLLILGWNLQGATIIQELDNYVLKGSEVTIMTQDIASVAEELKNINPLSNISLRFKNGDITSRKTLNDLNLPFYTNVMILSHTGNLMDIQEVDANTLVTLMHLRDIKRQNKCSFSIVSEMLDIKNRTLAEIAEPDDFIISDYIISLIIAQLAENKELKVVYDNLFDSHGSELYLKPIHLYLNSLDKEVNFYTIVEAASRRREIAIGYRIQKNANNPKLDYGVLLNPKKSRNIQFSEGDRIIVLAED